MSNKFETPKTEKVTFTPLLSFLTASISVFSPKWISRRKLDFLDQCNFPMRGLMHPPAPLNRPKHIIVLGPLRNLRKSRAFFFFLAFHCSICWTKHGLSCSTREPEMAIVDKSHDVSTHLCIWMWTYWQITACHSPMSELRWKCQFEQMPLFLFELQFKEVAGI